MRFPLWNVLCDDMLLSDDDRLTPDVRTPFDADYSDGGKVLFCYDLNLTKISKAWRALGTVETKRLYIHCARWQKPHIHELFEERCQSLGVELFYPEYTDLFETLKPAKHCCEHDGRWSLMNWFRRGGDDDRRDYDPAVRIR